ncbi:MAG TPA: hypothetical protein VGH11_04655 [Jatrophihabitans sp.]|jgi:hypothetical protein
MRFRNDSHIPLILIVALLLGLATACRQQSAASSIQSSIPAASSLTRPSTKPAPTRTVAVAPATGDFADAVRAAARHGLGVWLESDLVKRWRQGTSSFNQAVAQLGSLAAIRGVVGIKIADEMGYHDGLTTASQIKSFLTAASTALHRVAPGKQLLVDMIVPELGCLPNHQPPLLWATECTVKSRGQYPQLSTDSITSYLQMHAISVLDLSTGLLSDGSYAGWGVDRDDAQQAAWTAVRALGWPSLVTLHARKALAHPGNYPGTAAQAAADVRTWVDLPLAGGAQSIDVWTWRQMYQGSVNRLLNPDLQSNALWAALRARKAKGDVLFTHFSPHSLESSLNADLGVMAQVFSDVFVAAGTG